MKVFGGDISTEVLFDALKLEEAVWNALDGRHRNINTS